MSPSNHGRPVPPAAPAPRVNAPLPPRPAAPSGQGTGRPAAQAQPQVPTRSSFERRSQPAPAPAPVQPPVQPQAEQPAAPTGGGRYSLMTVILLAVLGGVVAFFLSKFLPI
ncbi:MAG: hypothetical protein U0736_13720 [Gemmataceae bacterium]